MNLYERFKIFLHFSLFYNKYFEKIVKDYTRGEGLRFFLEIGVFWKMK